VKLAPQFDLTKRWPFHDSSVGAFRAYDILEHLPDKLHTMREIYRCLRPGGWLLSRTPSALGQGGFQDPTHCSYWVPNSFRYHTERELSKYLPVSPDGWLGNPRFMQWRLFTEGGDIPYIVCDLVSLKDDDGSLPGQRRI
jgi:SAM-dependent methyltransferase